MQILENYLKTWEFRYCISILNEFVERTNISIIFKNISEVIALVQ